MLIDNLDVTIIMLEINLVSNKKNKFLLFKKIINILEKLV